MFEKPCLKIMLCNPDVGLARVRGSRPILLLCIPSSLSNKSCSVGRWRVYFSAISIARAYKRTSNA